MIQNLSCHWEFYLISCILHHKNALKDKMASSLHRFLIKTGSKYCKWQMTSGLMSGFANVKCGKVSEIATAHASVLSDANNSTSQSSKKCGRQTKKKGGDTRKKSICSNRLSFTIVEKVGCSDWLCSTFSDRFLWELCAMTFNKCIHIENGRQLRGSEQKQHQSHAEPMCNHFSTSLIMTNAYKIINFKRQIHIILCSHKQAHSVSVIQVQRFVWENDRDITLIAVSQAISIVMTKRISAHLYGKSPVRCVW